ncbi:hypothetical protein [Streptomyces sp. NPDC026673]|uniref:hypothetical protein n=1 Tax=Streptomyces sp. NPDC026673 TaxID=3155724 RepID=UPI00340C3EC5
MDHQLYGALRGYGAGRGGHRRRERRREPRKVLDAAGVASTTGAPSPSVREPADARGRGGAIRRVGLSQEEEWEAGARIAGQVWLGVHLPDGSGGLPDEGPYSPARVRDADP